jgi:hypothetical protein
MEPCMLYVGSISSTIFQYYCNAYMCGIVVVIVIHLCIFQEKRYIEDNPTEMKRLVLSKKGKVPDEVRAFIENTDLDGFISSSLRYSRTDILGSFFGEISAKAMLVWQMMHSTS